MSFRSDSVGFSEQAARSTLLYFWAPSLELSGVGPAMMAPVVGLSLVRTLTFRETPPTYRWPALSKAIPLYVLLSGKEVRGVSARWTPEGEPVVGIGPSTTPIATLVASEDRTYMLPAESNAISPFWAAASFPVGRLKVAMVPPMGVFLWVSKPYTVPVA